MPLNNIWEKRELKCYLCKLPCVAKEETMDFTDSSLDEIVSSLLHENVYMYRIFNKCKIFFIKECS